MLMVQMTEFDNGKRSYDHFRLKADAEKIHRLERIGDYLAKPFGASLFKTNRNSINHPNPNLTPKP